MLADVPHWREFDDNILIRHRNDTRNKLRQQNKIKRIEEMIYWREFGA